MQKSILLLSFLVIFSAAHAQPAATGLHFQQGQVIRINMAMKLDAGQQGAELHVDGSSIHSFKVTNSTAENTTLHHQVDHIGFNFDGLGQKVEFDSDKEKDIKGNFGKPVKELLEKSYDAIIDTNGKVLMVNPEKFAATTTDNRMAFVTNLLKDILDVVEPPRKNGSSFFKIFPDKPVSVGDSWSDTLLTEAVQSITNYKLSAITDSTYVIELTENAATTTKATIMGAESTTSMTNKTTGTIILSRQTGILKEKKLATESSGTTNIMGMPLPVTSKSSTVITVN